MTKKKIIILSTILFLAIAFAIGLFAKNYFEDKKSLNHLENIKQLILQEKYDDAIIQLNNAKKTKSTSTEIDNLSLLCTTITTVDSLYINKDYTQTLKLVETLKTNEYYSLVSQHSDNLVNQIRTSQINDVISKATSFLNSNQFDNGLKLINDSLSLAITDDQIKSLNTIKSTLQTKKNEIESKKRKDLYLSKYSTLVNVWDVTLERKYQELCVADFVSHTEKRYKAWDNLLNEIWKDLESFIPSDKLEALRNDQLKWIKDKEKSISSAEENTMGRHINFVLIDLNKYLATITRERCMFLINNYI